MKPEFEGVPQYLRLSAGGSRARLAILREECAHAKATNKPPSLTPADWRAARSWGFHNWRTAYMAGLHQGMNDNTPIWVSHGGEQFRGEKFAHECEGGPDHTGWFTMEHGETWRDGTGLARGIVARLPHGRFIAGYWWGDNGERVYFPDIYTEESEAARAADSHAERFADSAREDNAKWNAARELESEIEEKQSRLCECFGLRNHRKLGARMRDELRELVETLRGMRQRYETEFADYH